MTHYDEVQILASDCHGYFTSAMARNAGVKSYELDRWMKIGRLERPVRGVYRIANYPPSTIEPYALAVLAVGEKAAIYFSAFESVFSEFGAVVSLESLKKSRQNARQRQKAREMFLFDFDSLKLRRQKSASGGRAASAC